MTERTGTYTTPDGTAVHYEEHGEGLPVYVCHGGPTLSYTYMRQALEPLARRCTLVYHDYRGCGRSGRAAPETYRFEQLAADLDGLRAFLGHQRIVLLAHSMGGFVFFAALRFYRSGLPQARFVTFPDVGHYPALEEPEAFTRELVQFLDGVPERRQGGER